MRKLKFLAAILCLPVASAQTPQQLYNEHHWFALRAAIAGSNAPTLFAGAVAVAFDQRRQAESVLRTVIAGDPASNVAYQAHEWLTYMYLREGRYTEMAAEVAARNAAIPNRPSSPAEASLIDALRGLPNQATQQLVRSRIHYSMLHNNLVLPMLVNGLHVKFFADTGANFSIISLSQALSLGMTVNDRTASITGSSGNPATFRVASAKMVEIGGARLYNVAFLVLPDDAEPYQSMPLGQRGAIGIPVLLALESIQWTTRGAHKGIFAIAPSQPTLASTPNLCFDGASPSVELRYAGQPIDATLDMGEELTRLWPPFATRFLPGTAPTGKQQLMGVGGATTADSIDLPDAALDIGSFDIHLRPAHIVTTVTTPDSARYFGRIGIDALNQATSVKIDFGSMTVTMR